MRIDAVMKKEGSFTFWTKTAIIEKNLRALSMIYNGNSINKNEKHRISKVYRNTKHEILLNIGITKIKEFSRISNLILTVDADKFAPEKGKFCPVYPQITNRRRYNV